MMVMPAAETAAALRNDRLGMGCSFMDDRLQMVEDSKYGTNQSQLI
jgi:hypothetical protein